MTPEDSQWLCRELGYVLDSAAKEFNAQQGTLRDRFAMAALQGLLAEDVNHWCDPAKSAAKSYALADAMLAEREKKHEDTALPDRSERPPRGGHPMQPIALDSHRCARFKKNNIVEHLVEKGRLDLNLIAIMVQRGEFPQEDEEQLMQLLGYSVGGFCDLSRMSEAACEEASSISAALFARQAEAARMNESQTPADEGAR